MSDLFFPTLRLVAAETVAHGETHAAERAGLSFAGLMFYVIAIALLLLVLMASAKKGLAERVFHRPLTQAFEQLYLFVQYLTVGIIGSRGRKYIPIVMVFWSMIFLGNVASLFLPTSTTADLSFNLGMALIAIFYVQWEGIRSNGLGGHLSHFAGPKMGGILLAINGMIFVIELISEMMKNVSLSLRIYGNIDGGHRAAEAMNALGRDIIHLGDGLALSIPFGAFLLPIKLLTCVVQALIFCLLFCVYLSLVTHEEHETAHAETDTAHPALDAQPNVAPV